MVSINKMMLSMTMIVLFVSTTISSASLASSIDFNGKETKKHDEDITIHHNDMVLNEPTILRKTSIGKLMKQKEDEQQGHNNNHVDNIMKQKDVTMFHRTMADDCVVDEGEIRAAVSSNRPKINLCTRYIQLANEILLFSRNIQFNCVLTDKNEKCTIDAKKNDRHFWIDNSIISFKGISFVNGKNINVNDNNNDGGSLYINSASTVDIMDCDFSYNEAATDKGGVIAIKNSVSSIVNVTMLNNKAFTEGGAIHINDCFDIRITDSVISSNYASKVSFFLMTYHFNDIFLSTNTKYLPDILLLLLLL